MRPVVCALLLCAAPMGWLGCAKTAGEYQLLPSAAASGGPLEEDPVSVTVTRTRAAVLKSADGVVTLRVHALSVDGPVILTLARIRGDLAPSPRVGEGYVMRVEGGVLAVPARVEWSVGPQVSVSTKELRVATPNAQGALVPVQGAQVALDGVAGQVSQAATLVLVNRQDLGGAAWSADVTAAQAGDALLARADVNGAHAAYQAAKAAGEDAHATLGVAVTDLLLLAQQPPLSDVMLRCGLPQDALMSAVLGEGGVLAQAAQDRAGEALLTLEDAEGVHTLLADEIYARRRPGGDVELVASGRSWELRATLPSGSVTSAQHRAEFHGTLALTLGPDRYVWAPRAAGTVTYSHGAGVAPLVPVRLAGVVLTGAPGAVTLQGLLSDVVQAAPSLWDNLVTLETASSVPNLGGVAWHRLLAQCSPEFTEAWLRGKAAALAEHLAAIQEGLRHAAAGSPGGVMLVLPQGLTRLPTELPLTARDALLLSGFLGVARAVLTTAAAYQALGDRPDGGGVPLAALAVQGEVHSWDPDGGIVTGAAMVLDAPLWTSSFNRNLLTPVTLALDLEGPRVALLDATGDFFAGLLSSTAPGSGWLRPEALDDDSMARMVLFLDAAARSLPAHSAPVGVGPAGVELALGRLFDSPPTHATLTAGNQGLPLFQVYPGNPQAREPEGRDGVGLPSDHGFAHAVWKLAVTLPQPAPTCSGPQDDGCGPGYACVAATLGTCTQSILSCVDDGSCVLAGETCQKTNACQDALPPVAPWDALGNTFLGPHAPGWAGWSWHLWPPLAGRDPAAETLQGN